MNIKTKTFKQYQVVIFLLITLFFMTSALYSQNNDTLKVMTWNIRLDTPDDGLNQWKYRKDEFCREVVKQSPLILGVQEAFYSQLKDMKKRMKGYKYIGAGRDDGKKEGEFSAIFYKGQLLKVVRSGTFWLSETPDIPGSRGWDAACNRVVTWAEFKDKNTGKHFIALNTHFDHMGEIAQVESAKLIIKKLASIANHLPVILTGDFNVTQKSKAYRILTFSENEYTLSDSRTRVGAQITGPDFSFVGFDPTVEPTELIDFIMVSWDIDVIYNEILDFRAKGKYLSDHLPVIAILNIK